MTRLSYIYSAQVTGLKTRNITIEVDLFRGVHSFSVVGLPDKAVEESRDRVSSAIKSAGFTSPKSKGQQKVVVSLSPADLKKEGPLFDLPIALGYLLATGEICFEPQNRLFVGELSLGGSLLPIKGALLIAQKAKEAGFTELYLPSINAPEAALVSGICVYGAESLREVVEHINEGKKENEKSSIKIKQQEHTKVVSTQPSYATSFGDIKGQEAAKRGLEIAAAGGHNIAFYGPPGSGKTLLARALISILPPLSFEEGLEVTGIHSVRGILDDVFIATPPFRSPHHTASYTSVVGGGSYPQPGEATLAHNGVLFLDEFPEFDRRVIESLREPLEEHVIAISRAKGSEIFPARFILVAAFNPCPCGYYGDTLRACTCLPTQLIKYQRKISGPIIDRIDMWIEVSRIDNKELSQSVSHKHLLGEDMETKTMRRRVAKAREEQSRRFSKKDFSLNAEMRVRDLKYVILRDETKQILDEAAKKLDLSARAYHRSLKLARTIADIEGCEQILPQHILEAMQYRPKKSL
ncbi:MAG: YifB family Mg chelatase-like AAA ATPase [Candidatus Paceibacterota bacterium]